MQFVYKNASLPKENLAVINDAATSLYSKLKTINVASLDISDYNKRYFGDHQKKLRSRLQKYSYILAWSIAEMNMQISDCVVLDYGGGSGILSLLAKELKFKKVLYSDIYDISCRDAKIIGSTIGNQADHYIEGDIDEVIEYCKKNYIRCNSIVSDDVIEHIYDINYFIKKLPELSDDCCTIVMSSSANPYNPRTVRRLKKIHYEAEFKDREFYFGHKERDALESYYKLRKRIIEGNASDLSPLEVEELTKRTRGMIERDIINVINNYKISKMLPPMTEHPTNTCDPYTGNWAEHLMDIYQLKNQLNHVGFRSDIFPGYYGYLYLQNKTYQWNKIINTICVPMLNIFINLPKYGIYFSPYFTLYGVRCDLPGNHKMRS